jgi:aspartate dehydrogenase
MARRENSLIQDLVTIGIVGCGYRGSELAALIGSRFRNRAQIVGVYDVDFERAGSLASYLGPHIRVFPSVEDLVDRARLVIEVASDDAVAGLVKTALHAGRDVLITSVGGLVDHLELLEQADDSRGRLLVPSGMLAGVDAVKACREGSVASVLLTSRLPRSMLAESPYVRQHDIDIDSGTDDRTVFDGTGAEACRGFPVIADAVMTLALAGLGLERTRVRVVVTRRFEAPSYEIEVKGDFGRVITRTENVQFPPYPKLTYLAMQSAVAKLHQYLDSIVVGT